MSKEKFTSGEWEVNELMTTSFIGNEKEFIAEVYELEDANLMAQSKNMYHMLEKIRNYHPELTAAAYNIDKLLAKARGEHE